MPSLDDDIQPRKPKHPKGWEPGVDWDGRKGTITAALPSEPDDSVWEVLISDWGLDPERTQVVDGSLQIRAWDTMRDGETIRMKYYRATIAPREHGKDHADIEKLCRLVEKRKPKPVRTSTAADAFVCLLSDWQVGKGAAGSFFGGTEQTVERITKGLEGSVERFKTLRKLGLASSVVYLIGLGDMGENCQGFYDMMEWQTDLNRREQERLCRRLLLMAIDLFVDAGAEVIAMGVPGNHGENRKNGKAFTDFTDNSDVALFETVAEICAANPERYKNVSFPIGALNPDDLTLTLDISGVVCSFAHGHQFRSGTNAQAKMETWWKSQALGRTGVSDADILFAGHLHHFVLSEGTGRTIVQAPAMDGGSKWFTATAGASAPAGMLTMIIGKDSGPRGWSHLLIV